MRDLRLARQRRRSPGSVLVEEEIDCSDFAFAILAHACASYFRAREGVRMLYI